MNLVLSSHYFPPISYFKLLISSETTIVDVYENFIKQSYRNRCVIYGANGSLNLVVPVVKRRSGREMMHVKIDYTEDWQTKHWKSISSAYKASPYFEYYQEDLKTTFFEKSEMLVDHNQLQLSTIIGLLGLNPTLKISKSYINQRSEIDYRLLISPKKNAVASLKPYMQVFADRHGFMEDLSILDLLFNEGPNASTVLAN